MIKTFKIFQADAFTKEIFKGNPAGVVINADGLNETQMLSIARELNNSETAFIFSPEDKDHDVRIRFFTPAVEVPSCGHATIASHYIRAKENHLPSGTVFHKIGIGVLPVDILKLDDDYKIMMTQGKPEFLDIVKEDTKNKIINSLGLKEEDLYESLPVQIVSTGHSKVLIGIKSKQKLNSLLPVHNNLIEISKRIGCNGYFVFTLDSREKEILANGRMFAPAIGINEDPVTGNANGPLGAYLVKYSLVKHDENCFSFKSKQGEAINREGICYVEVFIDNRNPVRVKIGGYAVITFKTTLDLEIN
ncbi:MAG TPA: PhzF family isomerase [Ignavibacteriaceae bacterium]|nr:PhzF family isomerase [Ignavibacteriaceae bacterium]